jgi:hypothetical protein
MPSFFKGHYDISQSGHFYLGQIGHYHFGITDKGGGLEGDTYLDLVGI